MLKIEIQGAAGMGRAGEHLERAPSRMAFALEKAAREFGFAAEGIIKKDYLSGPRPQRLGAPSGRLRSSITPRVTLQNNNLVIQIGTNVEYAAAHEFGFNGTVNVPAHDRVVRKVFGRSVEERVANVRAHARKMNLRERPFLGPGVQDATPAFERRIGEILMSITEGMEANGE